MKHLKIIALAALAIVALMGFASSASSAVLTSPAGTEYTGDIHLTLDTPASGLFKAGLELTCGNISYTANIRTNGSSTASGVDEKTTYTDCTKTTNVLSNGSLSIATGGALTVIGGEVTIFDLGVSCVYGGGTGTKLGTLKGGTPAVLEAATTETPKISGGFLCASKGTFTGRFTVTTPSTLLVD
jgi:hypothetical protein